MNSIFISLFLSLAPPLQAPEGADAALAGPRTAEGDSGPARFLPALYEAFDPERALACTAFIDRYYRAPGNDGYEACLDEVARILGEAGYGVDPRLALSWIETDMRLPSWTPLRARLELTINGREPELLHGFGEPGGRDRVMLPVNAPSADVSGKCVFSLDEVEEGTLLVTDESGVGSLRRLMRDAAKKGAVAILSAKLFDFTEDPTGAERHLDAILFRTLPPDPALPVCQISTRTHQRLKDLGEAGTDFRLHFESEVRFEQRKLRTLVAEILGARHPLETVVIASHVQEPGAGDNASGVAGLAEGASILARLLREETLSWPSSSISFVWGHEYQQSSIWLEHTQRTAIAAISADMLGQSPSNTGAIALLERTPDPGALNTLPPDAHTAWGAGRVERKDMVPSGLSVIARTALHDVARQVGGWRTSENPWEGGSDHDVFLRSGVPAVLLWHFTDFTYHTGLDRLEMLDGEELRRTCIAVMAVALSVADARPGDLDRYLESLELEHVLRVEAAEASERKDVAEDWDAWCLGAAEWLRRLCAPESD